MVVILAVRLEVPIAMQPVAFHHLAFANAVRTAKGPGKIPRVFCAVRLDNVDY